MADFHNVEGMKAKAIIYSLAGEMLKLMDKRNKVIEATVKEGVGTETDGAEKCVVFASTSLAMAATVSDKIHNHSVRFKGEGTISRAFLSFSECIIKDDLASCVNPFDARIMSFYGITTVGDRVLNDKEMVANLHPESYGIYCQIFDTLVDMKWKEKAAILKLSIKRGTYPKVYYHVKITKAARRKQRFELPHLAFDDNRIVEHGIDPYGPLQSWDYKLLWECENLKGVAADVEDIMRLIKEAVKMKLSGVKIKTGDLTNFDLCIA
ncbi:hypothetical protein V6N12_067964 [Hibiscus sabdariffa]|uniref:Uncharacterized protein n=1 Tax=Hibiscus sabdariffa TaxID=183260 RepID=A0ABR2FNK6_9ROSI